MAVLMAMACLMAEVMAARIPLVARHLPTLPPLPLDMETLLTRPQRWSKRGACVASFSKACPRSGRARRSWRAIIHSNAIATCVCEPPMPHRLVHPRGCRGSRPLYVDSSRSEGEDQDLGSLGHRHQIPRRSRISHTTFRDGRSRIDAGTSWREKRPRRF